MEIEKLKLEFHRLIDIVNDTKVLEEFYYAINNYQEHDKNIDIIDELSDSQKQRLTESMEQSKNGVILQHETMKSEIKKWLTR